MRLGMHMSKSAEDHVLLYPNPKFLQNESDFDENQCHTGKESWRCWNAAQQADLESAENHVLYN